jgi:asparagine synthase (glutamine-hydrolysing)
VAALALPLGIHAVEMAKKLDLHQLPGNLRRIMCGIAGVFSLRGDKVFPAGYLKEMADAVRHRGPDDEGYLLGDWRSGELRSFSGDESSPGLRAVHPLLDSTQKATLGFGFRRLAILELSELGHQPMVLADAGLHIVFNGEIYNYLELRDELKELGYGFTTGSDTEVLLRAYQAWGARCVHKFNGIWSFAIWDASSKTLFCSRDRFGVKPFYYTVIDGLLLFGSEIKQLLPYIDRSRLNRRMIWRSMKINSMHVYGDETYFEQIKALGPGMNLVVRDGSVRLERYYELDPDTFNSSTLSFNEAAEHYRELFRSAVKLQTRSDVEVGACLSGGLDSSAIVCVASGFVPQKVRTFSAYFSAIPELDERQWISAVAEHSGSRNYLVSPSADAAWNEFEKVTWYNDLPPGAGFAAQYSVTQLAAKHGIKVLLDGQGSDELTGGYKHAHYRYVADLARKGKLLGAASEIIQASKGKPFSAKIGHTAKSLLSTLLHENALYNMEFHHYRFEPFSASFLKKHGLSADREILSEIRDLDAGKLASFLYNMIYLTSLQSLLHYEDRMAMAASVESRVPFLDHRLVEFAFSLPSAFKVGKGQGKLVHREAMREIVPPAIHARRGKAIFGTPFHARWMRNELRGKVEELLTSDVFRKRGIWNLPAVNTHWMKYKDGDDRPAEMLYNIIALEMWLRLHFPVETAIA